MSARYTMRYFATVSKSNSNADVEDKVLASNPITEVSFREYLSSLYSSKKEFWELPGIFGIFRNVLSA